MFPTPSVLIYLVTNGPRRIHVFTQLSRSGAHQIGMRMCSTDTWIFHVIGVLNKWDLAWLCCRVIFLHDIDTLVGRPSLASHSSLFPSNL